MTFGTPVAASNFAPFTNCNLMPDPGLFYPQTMMGVRDVNVFPLYGQEKISGPLDAPLFPTNGIHAWVGSVGTDNAQTGSAAGTVKNGTLASASQGATTLVYTVTNSTPAPVANDYIQIGPAVATFGSTAITAAGAPGVYQVVKITSVTGTGPYNLTVPALQYAVASNAVAQNCIAPFFHNVAPANALNSYTVEKNLGNYQSEQYAGSRFNKFSLRLPTTNAEASFSSDIIAQSVAVLSTPTAVTVDSAVPYVFAEGGVSLLGQTPQATNVEFNLENNLKDTFTIGNSHLAQFITPTTRKISGRLTTVFTSLNDVDWGYFTRALPSLGTPAQGALSLTLTHPGTGGSFFVNCPQVNFAKVGDEIKIGDIILQTLDFTASYSLTSATSMTSYVANATNTAL